MVEVEWNAMANIPFEVVPVTPLYPVLPCSEGECVHLAGIEVGKCEAACVEGERLHQEPFLRVERKGRVGVNLYLYFQRLLCLKTDVVDIGVVFQECGFHLPEAALVLLGDGHLSAQQSGLFYDGGEIRLKAEGGIFLQQGEVHVFGIIIKTCDNLSYPK